MASTLLSLKSIKQVLFEQIQLRVKHVCTPEFIQTTKTVNGGTQTSERVTILKMKEILDSMGLHYTEASSQQAIDFQDVGGIGLNLEIKKTDSVNVMFNDTCPSEDIYYIIIFTGKEFKNKKKMVDNIPPQICCLNGDDILKTCPWYEEFKVDFNALKDKYARGPNKKLRTGLLSVFPRANWKGDISPFLSK